MKSKRHAKILELIEAKELETQDELAAELSQNGIFRLLRRLFPGILKS